ELIRWAQPEQHRHAAITAIEKAAPPGAFPILCYREGANIAELAPIEVSRGPVVHGVGLLPIPEGEQGNQAQAGADPVIGSPARKKRTMPAVVLDDEQPYIQPRSRHCQQQSPTIAPTRVNTPGHQRPEQRKGSHSGAQLPQSANP